MKIKDIEFKNFRISKDQGEETIKVDIYFKDRKVGHYYENVSNDQTEIKITKGAIKELISVYKKFQMKKNSKSLSIDDESAVYIIKNLLIFQKWENEFKDALKMYGKDYKKIIFAFYNDSTELKTTENFIVPEGSDFEFEIEEIVKVIEKFKKQNSGELPKFFRVFQFDNIESFNMEKSLTERVIDTGYFE